MTGATDAAHRVIRPLDDGPPGVLLATHAMGTRFELLLCHAPDARAHTLAVGEAIIDDIQHWHRTLSAYEPSSVASALMALARDPNRQLRDVFLPVEPVLGDVLRYCEAMRRTTNGVFNLSHASAAAAGHGCDHGLEFDWTGPSRVRLSQPGQTIDFGSVAKGFVLDCAHALLREHAITRAMLHGGTSSVLALGAWTLGVRLHDAIVRLQVCDMHLSVSSTRERAHLVDPTGAVARASDWASRVRCACVLGPLATSQNDASPAQDRAEGGVGPGLVCEAWSTTLAITGQRPPQMPRELTTLIDREGHELEVLGPARHCVQPASVPTSHDQGSNA